MNKAVLSCLTLISLLVYVSFDKLTHVYNLYALPLVEPRPIPEIPQKHLAIISSTYFAADTSYGNGSMVFVLAAENDVSFDIWCWSNNGTSTDKAQLAMWPLGPPVKDHCKWSSRLAICIVGDAPVELALTDATEDAKIMVQYRKPIEEKYDVVACYAPIFYSEKWRTLVPLLEIHRQFGVNMQVFYVESALTSLFNYLSVYVEQRLVRLEPWYPTPVNRSAPGLEYDPNKELVFRNQAGGQTDCLILFKKSAEFVMFTDVDEILFPRLGGTYLEEFRYLSSNHPSAGSFLYPRYHATFVASNFPANYSIRSLLKSSVITKFTPHKCVARASRIRTNYYHKCINTEGYASIKVPESSNFMLHLRYEAKNNKMRNITPFKHQVSFLAPDGLIAQIEHKFRVFLDAHAKTEFLSLPAKEQYYDIFFKCYFDFARLQLVLKRNDFCPTHERCSIPKIPSLSCSVAAVPYVYGSLSPGVTVHYPTAPGYMHLSSDGC